jgi:protoporphyrinogen oxidase
VSRVAAEWDVVVIGAGPAGLAAAIEAERQGLRALLLEAEEEVGGLTRSFERDGYTFDRAGHLLHLADPDAARLVAAATPADAWNRVERRAAILLDGALVPYPFQQHLAYAPERVRRECVEQLPARPPAPDAGFATLAEWIRANIGAGIGRHFMVPYNEKLATVGVEELSPEWLGRFVPRPSLAEIRAGAERREPVRSGYNASFLYPARGGIAALGRGLAGLVGHLATGERVVELDTARRLVRTAGGESHSYAVAAVATLALPELAAIVTPAAAGLAAAARLRANTVTCVNFGLRTEERELSAHHWVYLPEPRFAAYRVGFYARAAESMAPPGREGVYVEIAHPHERTEAELLAAARSDLRELGVLAAEADVETTLPLRIEHAYVLPTPETARLPGLLREELRRRGVWTAGRYARWEYSAIEDALAEGIGAVRAIAAGA